MTFLPYQIGKIQKRFWQYTFAGLMENTHSLTERSLIGVEYDIISTDGTWQCLSKVQMHLLF